MSKGPSMCHMLTLTLVFTPHVLPHADCVPYVRPRDSTVLVSQGSCNKAPQAGWLRATEMYCLSSGGWKSEISMSAGPCSQTKVVMENLF